jgi:hypothetical protein
MERLATTLERYPLCRKLILFLLKNKEAMDNARGVALSWLQCDKAAAQDALDRLTYFGVIRTRTLTTGTVYGLTRNPGIVKWLEETVKGQSEDKRNAVPEPFAGRRSEIEGDQQTVYIDSDSSAGRDRPSKGRP